ncbi:f-box-like domain-containing protein [Ditylenchus destructor]|nr:f-box-like domain-containing protein [Ditylenchus destructor]
MQLSQNFNIASYSSDSGNLPHCTILFISESDSQQPFFGGQLADLEKITIDSLPDETLIKILQYLNLFTWIDAELVCKRWQRLAKYHCWKNFRVFSYKIFRQIQLHEKETCSLAAQKFLNNPEAGPFEYNITLTMLLGLLKRFGAYLEEFSFEKLLILESEADRDLHKAYQPGTILPFTLPKLHHLSIRYRSPHCQVHNNFCQSLVQYAAPRLTSAVLSGALTADLMKQFFDKCQFIEILGIDQDQIDPDQILGIDPDQTLGIDPDQRNLLIQLLSSDIQYPAGLKCISLNLNNNWDMSLIENTSLHYALLFSLWSQNVPIQSLTITVPCVLRAPLHQLMDLIGKFKSLRHLSLKDCGHVNYNVVPNTFHSLTNLQALEIEFGLFMSEEGLEVFRAIVENCGQVSHLGIHFPRSYNINDHFLPNLPNLTSLSVTFKENTPLSWGGSKAITKFFESIISEGKLQYFHTSAALSDEIVEKIMINCRDLRILSWSPTAYYPKMVHTSLSIVPGDFLPICERNERIMKIESPGDQSETVNILMKYLDSAPPSSVLESARFSGLTHKSCLFDELNGIAGKSN